MRKCIKLFSILFMVLLLFFVGSLIKDKVSLRNDIIRLHVVANSDSDIDQKNKLAVRDALIEYLESISGNFDSCEDAKAFLSSALPDLTDIANRTLRSVGCEDRAILSLQHEAFGIREYDTFTLPSGIYESLRVVIGDGMGKNWWCVVFPSLCMPKSEEVFVETAVSSGLDQNLADTLKNDRKYKIRFFILDWIGSIENFFCFS